MVKAPGVSQGDRVQVVLAGELGEAGTSLIHHGIGVSLLIHAVVGESGLVLRLMQAVIFPAQNASSQWRVDTNTETLAFTHRQNLYFGLTFDQRVHWLHGDGSQPTVDSTAAQGLGHLPGGKVTEGGINDFALLTQLIETTKGVVEVAVRSKQWM